MSKTSASRIPSRSDLRGPFRLASGMHRSVMNRAKFLAVLSSPDLGSVGECWSSNSSLCAEIKPASAWTASSDEPNVIPPPRECSASASPRRVCPFFISSDATAKSEGGMDIAVLWNLPPLRVRYPLFANLPSIVCTVGTGTLRFVRSKTTSRTSPAARSEFWIWFSASSTSGSKRDK